MKSTLQICLVIAGVTLAALLTTYLDALASGTPMWLFYAFAGGSVTFAIVVTAVFLVALKNR